MNNQDSPRNANNGQVSPRNANKTLANATPEQARWVLARLTCTTDRAAARKVGIHPSTVSKWPNKPQLDRAVCDLLQTPVAAILEILQQHGMEAAQVLADELKHKNRLAAANSILDRILGRAAQPITGEGGGPLTVIIERGEQCGTPD